ncbi:MAG: hypothetical protein AAF563_05205 [Pseudomonadota bacterium]
MALSAIIFLVLGIALIGFSVLSFQNIGDMPFMDREMEQSDRAGSRFARWHINVALFGGLLLIIGAALALLSES